MANEPSFVTNQPHTGIFSHLGHEGRESNESQPNTSRPTSSADSGYFSQSSLPGLRNSKTMDLPAKPLSQGRPVSLGRCELFHYKRPLGESCQPAKERFNEIVDHIQPLIVNQFKKWGAKHRQMTFRQMLLGKGSEEPQEYLVVLCLDDISGDLRSFLKGNLIIQGLLDPLDPGIPSFKVVVEGRLPKLMTDMSGLPVYDENSPSSDAISMCGRPVKFKDFGNSKTAVCGGIIEVEQEDGHKQFYGMLAGHSLLSVDGFDSLDESAPSTQDTSSQTLADSLYAKSQKLVNNKRPKLGAVAVGGYDDIRNSAPDYDWALFKFSKKVKLHSNFYFHVIPDIPDKPCVFQYVGTNVGEFPPGDSGLGVEMIGRNGLAKPGFLSDIPTRIFLGSADLATPVFTLTLSQGEVREGESGCWVVGLSTYDVFGHVVAVDMFGDAYVVPLQDTFRDIHRKLVSSKNSPQDIRKELWPKVQLPHAEEFLESSSLINCLPKEGMLELTQRAPREISAQRKQRDRFDEDETGLSSSSRWAPLRSLAQLPQSKQRDRLNQDDTVVSSDSGYGRGPGSHPPQRPKWPDIPDEVIEE